MAGEFATALMDRLGKPCVVDVDKWRESGVAYPVDDFSAALANKWENITDLNRNVAGTFIHPTDTDGMMEYKLASQPLVAAANKLTIQMTVRVVCATPGPGNPSELGYISLGVYRLARFPFPMIDRVGKVCVGTLYAYYDDPSWPDTAAPVIDKDGKLAVGIFGYAPKNGISIKLWTTARWEDEFGGNPIHWGQVHVQAELDDTTQTVSSIEYDDPGDFRGNLKLEITDTSVKASFIATHPAVFTKSTEIVEDSAGDYDHITVTLYHSGGGGVAVRMDDITSAVT